MLDRPPKDEPRPGAHPAIWVWGLVNLVVLVGLLWWAFR